MKAVGPRQTKQHKYAKNEMAATGPQVGIGAVSLDTADGIIEPRALLLKFGFGGETNCTLLV